MNIELFTITEGSPVVGKSIEELKFRTRTGTTILAVERGKEMHTSPGPEFALKPGDTVFVIGTREHVNKALLYLDEGDL
jgi:K+/H+ antiporter YhaU regulatory subunit KhtT